MEYSTFYLRLCLSEPWRRISKIKTLLTGMSPDTKRKLIMRINFTTILLLAACVHIYASGYGQRISLNERNAPLEKVLDKIELQSGYSFWLQTDLLLQKATRFRCI
jgi:hypothetical protein